MAISSSITQDIFEVILQLRRLPYMPSLNVRYISSEPILTSQLVVDQSQRYDGQIVPCN